MPTIAVVDDKRDNRKTRIRLIEGSIPEGWEVLGESPLPSVEQYPAWIMENEVAVLVLDERLDGFNYTGTGLAKYLRKHLPDFPIYLVTSYKGPENTEDRVIFERSFNRSDFDPKVELYVPRMVRAGRRFINEFEGDLSRLSKAAAKIAEGKGTNEDKKAAAAIQTGLNIAFQVGEFSDRADWINRFESAVQELEMTIKKLQTAVASASKKKKQKSK